METQGIKLKNKTLPRNLIEGFEFQLKYPVETWDENKVVKLLLFDAFINWMDQNWTKNPIRCSFLKNAAYVASNKMFYITCLLSVKQDHENSLFNVFNNFLALPKGPVDLDCYYLLNHCWHYTTEAMKKLEPFSSIESLTAFYQEYDNSSIKYWEFDEQSRIIVKRINCAGNINNYLEPLKQFSQADRENIVKKFEFYKEMLNSACEELVKCKALPGVRETERLISISQTRSWEKAFKTKDKKMSCNIDSLREDAHFLRWIIEPVPIP